MNKKLVAKKWLAEKLAKKLTVTLGQDLSCYASIEVPEDTDLSRENLTRIANEAVENAVFDADWSTCCALRIVAVSNGKGVNLVEDMSIDPSPYDAGQALMGWLRGRETTLQSVINSAAQAGLIEGEARSEVVIGRIDLPSSGAEVKFSVREGATLEEKDLAFFHALCQIATVDYQKESCHE